MTSQLDWRILEALDNRKWRANFHAKLAGWPKTGMCWEWQGARDERGFGRVRLPVEAGGQTVHPHRVCWLEKHGLVHPGLVLHPVGSRSCANPRCWVERATGRLPLALKLTRGSFAVEPSVKHSERIS